jgi:hypothetical protein
VKLVDHRTHQGFHLNGVAGWYPAKSQLDFKVFRVGHIPLDAGPLFLRSTP